MPLRRIRSLDGLRGCAIGLVLLAHLAGTAGFPIGRSEAAGRLGDLGVKIFFVLSGYLITCGVLLIFAVIPVARAAILAFVPAMGEGVERSFLTACDGFAVGAFVALARERLEQIPLYQRIVAWPATPALAIALALPLNLLQHHPLVYYALVQPVLYAGIALVVHHCVYRPEGGAGRLFASSALVRLGAVSYSLYLWQQPFLNWRSTGVLQTFPVNLLLTGACAGLSYYFVERTALNVRDRWFASDDSGSAAVEAEGAVSTRLLAN